MTKEIYNKEDEIMGNSVLAPARGVFDFTASDTVNEDLAAKSVACSVAGVATVVFVDGTVLTLFPFLVGTVYPFQLKRVNSTGLVATLHGLI